MAEFRIRLTVDPSGVNRGAGQAETRLRRLGSTADSVRSLIQRAFAFVGLGYGINQLTQLVDTFRHIQNRVRTVTTSTEQLNAVTKELFAVSQRSRSNFAATAEVYTRVGLATREMGLTANEALQFTESLNQAVLLSGANAQEAAAGLIQLSQGLASGSLRGDELRSVLEQIPVVADVIAKQLGISRGELRAFGAQGKITARDVVIGFQKARKELQERFGKYIPTLSQSFVILKNSLIFAIGRLNEVSGASTALSRAIIFLAENMETIIKVAEVLATVIGVNLAYKAIGALIFKLRALFVLLAANPITALIGAIAAATAAIITFSDEIKITNGSIATLSDISNVVFDDFKKSLPEITFEDIVKSIADTTKNIENKFKPAVLDGVQQLKKTQPAAYALFATISQGMELTGNSVYNATENIRNNLSSVFEKLSQKFSGVFRDFEFSIKGFVVVFARINDLIIGIWRGMANVLITIVRELVIRTKRKFQEMFNSIIDYYQKIFNAIATNLQKTIDKIPGIDKQVFKKIDLSKLKTDITPIRDLSSAISTAFKEGLDFNSFNDIVEKFFNEYLPRAEQRARERIAKARAQREAELRKLNETFGQPSGRLKADVGGVLEKLGQEAKLLQMNIKERKIYQDLLKIEDRLNRKLTESESELIISALKSNQQLRERAKILDDLQKPQIELEDKQRILISLYAEGSVTLQQFNKAIEELRVQQAQLNIEQGNGSFTDGFISGLENALEATRNFTAEAGKEFSSFTESVSSGLGQATAQAIVFGESFKEGVGNAARQALAELIGALVKLGVQFVTNSLLAQTTMEATTALSQVAAGAVAAAWASPAALTSLATFGANAAPANAALTTTVGLAQSLAAFADGGYVNGLGNSRSDSNLSLLSNGEFVVNAKSTSKYRPLLEQINSDNNSRTNTEGGASITSPLQQPTNDKNQELNIINVLDPKLVANYLTTRDGRKVFVNVIQKEASQIKRILS